ncbi:hypothetical protein ABLE93_02760 [Xanthobacter sp. KR7-65]|uniref:hypothetical protein n=1 Tax=Xanthobacter sp. KR7-65 TaxID=3156612 RepID=UPI0032B3FC5F
MMNDTAVSPIAPEAIARWTALSEDAPLRLALTRTDLDNLLLALRTLAIGQSELTAAVAAHVNQDHGACVDAMMRASELSHAAFDRINALVGSVMKGAVIAGMEAAAP